MSYDRWLEQPYQATQARGPGECPDCGEPLSEDAREQDVWCDECGYSYGTDWDAVAEMRAEAGEYA